MNALELQDTFPRFVKTVVTLDVGRSAVKGYALFNGIKIPLVYPSIVTRARVLADADAMARVADKTVVVDGVAYFTGEAARLHGQADRNAGLTADWTDGDEYKALVLGAFSRFSHLGVQSLEDAYVVVGIPADHY